MIKKYRIEEAETLAIAVLKNIDRTKLRNAMLGMCQLDVATDEMMVDEEDVLRWIRSEQAKRN